MKNLSAPLFVAVLLAAQGSSTVTFAAVTLPENIPDFSQGTSRPAVQSAQSGAWSSSSIWGGSIPTANHVVRIVQGHTVTIDDTSAVAYTIAVDGKLAFTPTVNTRLKVTNLLVMAGDMGMGTPGILEVGSTAAPIAVNVTAEILIADSPLGGSLPDPDQFGTGIIVFGRVSMHGSVKTPTFLRLSIEPRAGNTTLTLSAPASGWKIGDRLVLPDTRHIKESEATGGGWVNAINQWEERTVQAISADGRTLTFNNALQYDHLGARDLNGVLEFLPHVGNLTRNVVIRSENPSGNRGYMLSIHVADVDIRYVVFKDMGRTTYLPLDNTANHIGRYAIHMHHLSGPLPTPANGYQFTLVGNAVDGGSVETKFKWGITVHGSHYGLIKGQRNNTRFEAPAGRSLGSIAMIRDVASAPECLNKLDEARVYAYNRNVGDNFQVYHSSSSVLPRPPASCSPTTRPGVAGLTCPIAPLTGLPAPRAPHIFP